MPFKLTVDIPSGQEVFIHGLGTFQAGTHDISDEQAEMYEVLNTTNLVSVGTKDLNSDKDAVEAEHLIQRGTPLETAVASMHGISIEKVQVDKGKDDTSKTKTPTRPVDPGTAGSGTPATGKSGGEN